MGHRQKYNDTTRVPNEFVTFYCGQVPQLKTIINGQLTIHRTVISCMKWTKRYNVYCGRNISGTNNGIEFWDSMLRQISDKQSLTILSYDLVLQLALSDFWQWVDKREVHFWNDPKNAPDKDKKKWIGSLVMSDPPNYISFRIGSRTVKICDLRNYVTVSLLELLQAAGYRTHQYSHNPSGPFVSDQASVEITDALGIVYRNWLTRWKEKDCGVWQPTAARLAMNSLRHKLGNVNRDIERDNEGLAIDEWQDRPIPRVYMCDNVERKQFERAAYFSGRAEAFRTGEYVGRVYYADVRSMYPFLASCLHLPYAFHRSITTDYSNSLLTLHPSMQAIAMVTINTDKPIYPTRVDANCLDKHNFAAGVPNLIVDLVESRVIFPVGRFKTILCGEELKHAIENNHVEKVWCADIYKCAVMFKEYFEFWYNERCNAESNGDKIFAQLCKLMMNSLIGKFGQRSGQWENRPEIPALKKWGTAIILRDGEPKAIHQRFISGHTQQLCEPKEIENSAPSIPAFVCSAGRLMLWNLMNYAGLDNVLFCNTDGFAVTQQGKDNLELANLLSADCWGTLRITDTADECWIQDACHYRWGAETVNAGFPTDRTIVHNGCIFGWTKNHIPLNPNSLLPGSFNVKLLHNNWKAKYMGRMVYSDGHTEPWRV